MIDLVRLFASSPFRFLLFLPFRSLLLVQPGREDRELPGPYVFRDDAPASADLPVVVQTASRRSQPIVLRLLSIPVCGRNRDQDASLEHISQRRPAVDDPPQNRVEFGRNCAGFWTAWVGIAGSLWCVRDVFESGSVHLLAPPAHGSLCAEVFFV